MDAVIETRILIRGEEISFLVGTIGKDLPFSQDKFTLEFSIARIFHRVLNVYRLINNQIFEHNDFIILGDSLSKILFENELTTESRRAIDNLMTKFRTAFLDPNVRCRIYLQFDPQAGDVAMLPWEYLRLKLETYEGQNKKEHAVYLAADKEAKFDLIRSFPLYDNFNPPPIADKINVVVVTSQCRGPFNIDEEDKFNDWKDKFDKDAVSFHMLEQPDDDYDSAAKQPKFILQLKKIVDSFSGPYILHYFGHARIEQLTGQLSFVDKARNAVWIDDARFAGYFDDIVRKPHLVVLQACSSGQITGTHKMADKSDGKTKTEFSGVAVRLVQNEIPAVVAMQNDVTEEASLEFLSKFYEALVDGDDIAEAVTRGRTYLAYDYNAHKGKQTEKLKDHSSNVFGTPVLFLSVPQPFAFMKKAIRVQQTPDQKYKFCIQCKEAFENNPGNRHYGHDAMQLTEELYRRMAKETASENTAQTLSPVAAVSREADALNEPGNKGAVSAGGTELTSSAAADNRQNPMRR